MSLLEQNIIEKNMIPLHNIGVRVWGHSGLNEIPHDDLLRIQDRLKNRIGLRSSWITLYEIFEEVLELRSGIHFRGMDIYCITPQIIMTGRNSTILPQGLYIKLFTSGMCPALIVYGCNDWDQNCKDYPIHYRGELGDCDNTIRIRQSTIEDLAGPIKYPSVFKDGQWESLETNLYINKRLI